MKTAMQELIEWTEKYEGKMISADQVLLKAHKLIEKEKEQIIIAFIHNRYVLSGGHPIRRDYAEEYYNQIYKPETI